MNPAASRRTTAGNLTEVEGLLTSDQRRTVTIENPFNEANPFNDDAINFDPYNGDPPSRRKDIELDRVLSILDSIDERGNG